MCCRFLIWLVLGAAACQLYDDGPLSGASSLPSQGSGSVESPATQQPEACTPNPDGLDSACPEVCPEQCNGRDDDCDGQVDEASANATCAAQSAESLCFAGRCEIVRCLETARDCDGLAANGCEVTLESVEHCGGCGRRCALAHAVSACQAGACALDACQPGYADCDAIGGNGCETSLLTQDNCGGCGIVCSEGERCSGAVCSKPAAPNPACPYAADSGALQSPDECVDLCPQDPGKRAPGRCGCGVADVDSDADGTVDCLDACPSGAWTAGPCLPYAPANLDPTAIDFSNATAAVFNCGITTLDTSAATPVLSNACGVTVSTSQHTQADGSNIAVLSVRGLTVALGSSLRLVGSRPVAIAVLGDVLVDGSIDANAAAEVPGAGGDLSCSASAGTDGSGSPSLGGGGGGGGGFGTPGAAGGTGDGARVGGGGVTRGDESLVPLHGGCGGGHGGGCSARAAGGGAVQLSASGRISVNGTIRANGAAGVPGCGSEGGGSGGGSGGAILLEARAIEALPFALEAKGGDGGDASGAGGDGATAPTLAGSVGQSHSANGGGGGGGGYGRIHTLLH